MPRWLVLVVLMAALVALAGGPGAAAPDLAAKPAPKLPPAPIKCQTPDGDGCYGRDFGPEYMDNTFLGDMTISPHIVKAGQSVEVTMEVADSPDWDAQAGDPCHKAHCSIKMTAPTSDWLRYPGTFCFDPAVACGSEQDAVYVLGEDEFAISGNVTDADGKGVKGARIDISPGFYAVTENINGLYQALLKKGTYTVTGPAGYCVKDVSPCTRSKVVNLTGAVAVDFAAPATYTIAGTVKSRSCTTHGCTLKPLAGATVTARGPDGATRKVSDARGRYEMKDLPEGEYRVSADKQPSDEDHELEPDRYELTLDRDRTGIDFVRCASTADGASAWRGDPTCKVTITGSVTDLDNRPIANRYLGAYAVGPGGARLFASAQTNESGQFKVKVPPGRYTLTMIQGYEGEWAIDTDRPMDRHLLLKVLPKLKLRSTSELGVLMDLTNAPVAGGTLTARVQRYPRVPGAGCTTLAFLRITQPPDSPRAQFALAVGGALEKPLCEGRFGAAVLWHSEVLIEKRFDVTSDD